jgi:hypothetical protein
MRQDRTMSFFLAAARFASDRVGAVACASSNSNWNNNANFQQADD